MQVNKEYRKQDINSDMPKSGKLIYFRDTVMEK